MAPSIFQKLFAGGGSLPRVAPVGRVSSDLIGYASTVDHPGHGVTPQVIVGCFRDAESGNPQRQCDLIDDLIENDAHLRNLFEQRSQAVAGKPWVLQSGDQADEAELAATVLREAFRRLPMVEVFEHLLSFNRYGYACAEIEWGVIEIEGRQWVAPVGLHPVAARRFRITNPSTPGVKKLDELRLYADVSRPQGDELLPWRWLILRRSGTQVARSGLMRTGAWPAMAKRYGFRDAIIFSEKYGLPFPLAQYQTQGTQADDEAIDTAEKIIQNFGSDNGAVHPDTIKIAFAEVGSNGDSRSVHGSLISLANREMSKLVNGSTLSNDNSDSGGASYALGEVHDSVRWEAVQYDAEKLQGAFEQQVFAPFLHFNGLPPVRTELRVQVVRNLEPKARVALADMMVNKLGMSLSQSQLRSDTGFRAPTDDDDAIAGAPKPDPVAPPSEPAPAKEAA